MAELVISALRKEGNRLICEVNDPEKGQYSIWVETESDYSSFLCDDRADGFFIICLYRAIKEGYNLKSLVPVSERLYYQASTYLLNFYSEIFGKDKIKVSAPITCSPIPLGKAVATGISCGVDSLYTVLEHTGLLTESYNVTHLVLLNVGAYHIASEDPAVMFEIEIARAREFCKQYGYSFVKVDSNIRDYLPYSFTEYHGIVNGSTILTLQSLFRTYYSSSSYRISEFKVDKMDLSHVELFNLSVLSTDNTVFYTTGGEVSRFDKVKALAKWSPSYDTLHVCNSHSKNCSDYRCVKCCRTILELDAIDALDNYKTVFDVDKYRSNLKDYLAEFWARKVLRHDHYAIEMWPELTHKYKIPIGAKIAALVRFISLRLKIYNLQTIKELIQSR